MINEYCAKTYCCEDLSLIENYELAVNDHTQTWHCHHRGEILPRGRFSRDDLKKFGLYYKRPASELIFLTHYEHRSLHWKGVHRGPLSEDHKKALGDAKKGVPRGPLSEEHKKAIGEANSKKIIQFTKSGEFIREWRSAKEAALTLGVARSGICNCCKNRSKVSNGFIWKYA